AVGRPLAGAFRSRAHDRTGAVVGLRGDKHQRAPSAAAFERRCVERVIERVKQDGPRRHGITLALESGVTFAAVACGLSPVLAARDPFTGFTAQLCVTTRTGAPKVRAALAGVGKDCRNKPRASATPVATIEASNSVASAIGVRRLLPCT